MVMLTEDKEEGKPIKRHLTYIDIIRAISRMLGRLERFNRLFSRLLSWVGIVAIVMLVLITCIDVLGGKLLKWPFPGFDDAVGLCQLVAISFGMGATYLAGMHIKVDLFIDRIPKQGQAAINSVVELLGLVLFILIIWQLFLLGRSFRFLVK